MYFLHICIIYRYCCIFRCLNALYPISVLPNEPPTSCHCPESELAHQHRYLAVGAEGREFLTFLVQNGIFQFFPPEIGNPPQFQ